MRAHRWRTALMGPPDTWSDVRSPIDLRTSEYLGQITLDIHRTFPDEHWFDPHRKKLVDLLNTFASVNVGIGYIQGMNYLIFPLWKVYYENCPEWAVEDTLCSMQSIMHMTLRAYPTHVSDTRTTSYLKTLSGVVRLRCTTLCPAMNILFDNEYEPFIMSVISTVIPTMFATVLQLDHVMVLWDQFFAAESKRRMFNRVVDTLVCLLVHHKNLFIHLPICTAMDVFSRLTRQTLDQYVVMKTIEVFAPHVSLRSSSTIAPT